MSPELKKLVPIFLSILFGAGIIFFSIKSGALFGGANSFGLKDGASAQNNPADGSLKIVPPTSPQKLLGAEAGSPDATTTTSLLARELLVSYTNAQINKGNAPLDSTDTDAITQTLSEKARSGDEVKQYSAKDFIVVKTSTSTLETYKKEMSAVLKAFTQKGGNDELFIVATAVDNNDSSKLASLAINIANLQKLVNDLLALKVPSSVLTFHLYMTQGYATMMSGVVDMQQIIDDPVRGMRGIAKYNNGAGLLDKALGMLKTK